MKLVESSRNVPQHNSVEFLCWRGPGHNQPSQKTMRKLMVNWPGNPVGLKLGLCLDVYNKVCPMIFL